jgi:hypothetical protein
MRLWEKLFGRTHTLNEVRDILQERLGYLTTTQFILALTMAGVARPERKLPDHVNQGGFDAIENAWKKVIADRIGME